MTPQQRIEEIRRRLKRTLDRMPEELAIVAENYSLDRFKKEDWDGVKWKKRKRDSLGNEKRENRRGLLVESGAMRRGIRRQVFPKGFFIISDEPYSEIHNEGGTINHPGGTGYIVIEKGGKPQAVFVSKRKARELKREGRLVKKTKPHPIKIPQRKFIGKSRRLSALMRRRFIQLTTQAFN